MLTNFNYTHFLKQAYIDPIRTVTVIDDEYPTLEELIKDGKDKFKQDDITRLSAIIKVSRSEEFNWLLDVYNGKEDKIGSGNVTSRLHHSDLLILDYHLDGEDNGLCQKSIDIISNLASNRHFNIVAVHTKGYTGDKGTINEVLIDIIISLQKKPDFLRLDETKNSNIGEAIDEWDIESPGIENEILESINTLDLLLILKTFSNKILASNFEHQYWEHFSGIFAKKPNDIEISKTDLTKWLCNKKLEKYEGQFREESVEFLDWGVDGELNWVKTEDLFLTVIGKKQTSVSDIPGKILDAMNKSKPHPHELILSKLRSEVECNGISASRNILQNKYLQAAWLKELLREDTMHAIKTVSWSVVSKLWEELAQEIRPQIGNFTEELVKGLKKLDNPLDLFIENNTLANNNEIVKHANCFSCSRKISSHHLITGHVIFFNNNYWLCLTPMCDLVPGQKTETSLMSITLVQMYDAKVALEVTRKNMCTSLGMNITSLPKLEESEIISQIIEYSTENNLLFIAPKGKESEIKILSFTYGLDAKSSPKAKDFYVEDFGLFDSENSKIKLQYVEPTSASNTSELQNKKVEATVVAELRYEYALNLLRKLGVARSRVGLDFIR